MSSGADLLETSREIGKLVLQVNGPIIREAPDGHRLDSWFFGRGFRHYMREPTEKKDFDADAFFGIFCLTGCWLEQLEARTSLSKLLKELEQSEWWYIMKSLDFSTILFERIKADNHNQLQQCLDTHKLTSQQQEFVRKWVSRKLKLIGRRG